MIRGFPELKDFVDDWMYQIEGLARYKIKLDAA
jgi:hypothetical protein